jgi:hypothetical protein
MGPLHLAIPYTGLRPAINLEESPPHDGLVNCRSDIFFLLANLG